MISRIRQGILVLIVLAGCWPSVLAGPAAHDEVKSARSSAVLPFNCLAPGNICMNNGTCNHATKKCDCPSGYQGYNCEAPTNLQTCAVTCKNGASCSGEICYCAEGYVGGSCQHARVQLECTETGIVPQMAPYGYPFSGKIHVRRRSCDSNCQLVVEFIPILYLRTLAFTDCGIANLYSPGYGTQRVFDVVFHHDENVTAGPDFAMTFRCLYHSNGTLEAVAATIRELRAELMDGIGSARREIQDKITAMIANGLSSPNPGTKVREAKIAGDPLQLIIERVPGSSYADMQIDEVSAGSTVLVKGGCVPQGMNYIVQSIAKNPGNKATTVYFTAFATKDQLQVTVNVKVKLCTSSCTAPDCSQSSPTVSGDVEENLELSFAMHNPFNLADECPAPSPTAAAPAPCEDNKNFYFVPVVVLAILCVIAVIAAIAGCVMWNQAKKSY